jgi:hypothetical protein
MRRGPLLTSLTLPLFSGLTADFAIDDLTGEAGKRSPLYYLNHFQFKHGNLFRAILGKEVIWDKRWEMRLVNALDRLYHKLIDHGYYSLECFQSKIAWAVSFKGRLWVNGQRPFDLQRGKMGTIVVKPSGKIYVRQDGERVDVEGSSRHTGEEITITMTREAWQRLEPGFEVISGKKSESSTRQSPPLDVPPVSEDAGSEAD